MKMKNPYVQLAQTTVEVYVKTGKRATLPDDLPKEMLANQAGVFVSLHKKSDDSLRGCIGTFLPTKENIAQEIVANAVAAAHDPRFPPLKQEELPDLVYSVDILSKPKLVPNTYPLNPKKHGLLISTPDGRKGLLLPDIPGVETAEEQVAICKRKGGISPEEKVKFQIFTVERHDKHG